MEQMDELNKTLRGKAISLGLCQQWQGMWERDWDKETMIRMFIRGLDFCLDNRYPSVDFIKSNFDVSSLRRNAILVDDKYSLLNEPSCVLLGNSKSNIRYNSHYVGNVWLCDNSSAVITAKSKSSVIVHVVDKDTLLSVSTLEKATVTVIFHDEGCQPVIADGNVKFRNEYGLFPKRHTS